MKKRGKEKSKKETSNSGEKLKGRRDSYHQGEKKKNPKKLIVGMSAGTVRDF